MQPSGLRENPDLTAEKVYSFTVQKAHHSQIQTSKLDLEFLQLGTRNSRLHILKMENDKYEIKNKTIGALKEMHFSYNNIECESTSNNATF